MSLPDSVWKNAYDMVGEALAVDATDAIFSEPRPKRRKTQLACNCCRVRKTRCDGGRPVCFACEKRGSIQDCLYEEGASKTRQYIQKLETRLKQLEKGRGSQHDRSEDGSRPHVPGRPAGDMTQSRWTGRAGSPSQVESPDGLATVSASLHRLNLPYGESSTIAFVEHVLLTTGSTDEIDGGSSVSEDNSGASIHTMGQSGLKTDHPESLDVLPIRRISDRYLQIFWNIVHPDSQVPLPQMIDDEYLLEDGEGTQPEDSPCRKGLFVYTVRLLDILSEVLGSFYAEAGHAQIVSSDKNQHTSIPDLHEMLRLNSKLDQLLEAIPASLRLKLVLRNSETPSGSALLQARILYCRSSAWWTVYFTFCAATFILASLPHITEEGPTASMDTSLSLAMEIFKHYTSEVASSAQAMQVIETLRDRLSGARNTGTSTPPSCQTSEEVDDDSGALSGFTFGNAEGYIPGLTPDPLSEDWFSHEAMKFNFQEFLQELR
ncbi:transcriptional regulatory [Fusarium albosuccineum]|uniref:Transcriptional regulatory n=1 Tax=Fusarium albosuccineum TaxID=1237068 RepID=A0A8H4NWP9_9HYPO|nr:transcriptional regulatory [Fusarium albosuccineum]